MSEPTTIEANARAATEAGLRDMVNQAATAIRGIREASAPEAVQRRIDAKLADVRNKNTFSGILIAPEAALAKVEALERERDDADTLASADLALKALRVAEQLVAARIAQERQIAVGPAPVVERAARYQERDELRRQFAQQPLSRLLDFYQTTSDADAREAIGWIEQEATSGFPTIAARTGEAEDLAALQQLQKAIHARRDARVPLWLQSVAADFAARVTSIDRMALHALVDRSARPAERPARQTAIA